MAEKIELKGKKVAIYCRTASKSQTSDTTQAKELTAYANDSGGNVTGMYFDSGYSGRSEHRPALNALIAAAKTGGIDIVLTQDPNRIARDVLLYQRIVDRMAKCQIKFLNESPELQIMHSMLGVFTHYERQKMREYVKAGMTASQKRRSYQYLRCPDCGSTQRLESKRKRR